MTIDAARARILLVGNPDPVHVGAHFMSAAHTLGIAVRLCDSRDAFAAPAWRRKLNWWLRGHRPSALRSFSERVVHAARADRVSAVLTTGIAPLDVDAVRMLGRLGVKRLNFLTDDPWNPEHRAPWFLHALHHYDHVFTPRRGNMADLRSLGGPAVSYLPFAYAPETHHPAASLTAGDRERFRADLVFVGGADPDRVRVVTPFIEAGFDVALYGGYWDRYASTRAHARGFLNADDLRKAIGGGAVSLCLVRRANRDGHSMRSFEVAAMAGCMLVEDTDEHRQIFGAGENAVTYFRTSRDGIVSLRALVDNATRRAAMSARVRELVCHGEHTYAARLREMTAICVAADVA